MTNTMSERPLIDLAIEVLSATNDGDDLHEDELLLVQAATNGWLSGFGEKSFRAMHDAIMAGRHPDPEGRSWPMIYGSMMEG